MVWCTFLMIHLEIFCEHTDGFINVLRDHSLRFLDSQIRSTCFWTKNSQLQWSCSLWPAPLPPIMSGTLSRWWCSVCLSFCEVWTVPQNQLPISQTVAVSFLNITASRPSEMDFQSFDIYREPYNVLMNPSDGLATTTLREEYFVWSLILHSVLL